MKLEARLKEVDLPAINGDFAEVTSGYVAVKTRSMFPGTRVPCDIFYPALNGNQVSLDLEKILPAGRLYENRFHETLEVEGIEEIYIRSGDEDCFIAYFNEQILQSIKSPVIKSDRKIQLLYDNAQWIVEKVFRERPSASNVGLAKQLIDTFALHLNSEQVEVQAVLNLFSKDYYTFTHSVQVAVLGMQFCKHLGLSTMEITDFGIGALFHDIGKNSIREEILNKPAKLEKEEIEIIHGHPLLGFEQLSAAQVVTESQLAVVLYHHEAMDGSGYPDGLFGTQIPRYARIGHIVDVFDALISKRVYKEALSRDDALNLMRTRMSASFDMEMLEAFCEFLGRRESGRAKPRRRLRIDLDTRIVLQYEAQGKRLRSTLVGMEDGEYLILRAAGLSHMPEFISTVKSVVARYTHDGTVYGFRSKVLGAATQPFPLLFLSYPHQIEELSLRKDPRVECFLPATAVTRKLAYNGMILDLSLGGCRLGVKNEVREKLPPALLDEEVLLRIQLIGESGSQELPGTIRRVDQVAEKTMLGIQFAELPEAATARLRRFIERMLVLAD
jgi:HD-GYP domain-containing protein (c-di-GMP phosphodiesterase class II)/c-di-GMP-binding flagellar brake protein YcgR